MIRPSLALLDIEDARRGCHISPTCQPSFHTCNSGQNLHPSSASEDMRILLLQCNRSHYRIQESTRLSVSGSLPPCLVSASTIVKLGCLSFGSREFYWSCPSHTVEHFLASIALFCFGYVLHDTGALALFERILAAYISWTMSFYTGLQLTWSRL
jgi:hypothetical protein